MQLMRRSFSQILKVQILFFVLITLFAGKYAYAESINVQLQVSVCNANLICEDVIGENYGSCPSDCEAPPEPPAPPVVDTGPQTAPQGSGGFSNTTVFTNIPAAGNPNQSTSTTTQNQNGFPAGVEHKPEATLPGLGVNGVISISPDTNQVTLNFKTFLPSLVTVSWGKTPTYEIGSSAEASYRSNFATRIQNLEAGTTYYYRLSLLDSIGRTIDYEGIFTTSNRFIKAPLPSPTDFRARQGLQGNGIELTWNIEPVLQTLQQEYEKNKNDLDPRNDVVSPQLYVRLVRSEFKFPTDPLEGKVVYEGRGERVSDFDVIDGKKYFYSLFVLNQKGQYSSPNVIRFLYGGLKNVADNADNVDLNSANNQNTEGGALNSETQYYDPLIKNKDAVPLKDLIEAEERMGYCGISQSQKPLLGQGNSALSADAAQKEGQDNDILIRFLQDNKEVELKKDVVLARDGSKLIVHIEGALVKDATNLSMCLVSMQTGRQNHYLLSQNQDGSYELILPAFFHKNGGKNGYQFSLGMLKYEGEETVLLRGEIQFDSGLKTSSKKTLTVSFFLILLILAWRARKIMGLLNIWKT